MRFDVRPEELVDPKLGRVFHQPAAADLGDDLAEADLRDDDFAAESGCRLQRVRGLLGAECNSDIGADSWPRQDACVAVDARGNIDGDDSCAGSVHLLCRKGGFAGERTRQACAEEAV